MDGADRMRAATSNRTGASGVKRSERAVCEENKRAGCM